MVLENTCVHDALKILVCDELSAAKPGSVAPVPVDSVEGSGKVFTAGFESKTVDAQSVSFDVSLSSMRIMP